MEQNNKKYLDFQSFNLIKSNISSKEIIDTNFLNKDSILNNSYSESFELDSISKRIYNAINTCFAPKNEGKNPDIKKVEDKNVKEENISITSKNKSPISMVIGSSSSILKEKPNIVHKGSSKDKPAKSRKVLGRKKNEEAQSQSENSSHGIYSEDNISIKIQTHYLNFIIDILNCIFPYLNLNKKLYKLDKEFKINIKQNNSKSNAGPLNKKTIGDIICNKISIKYKSIHDKINANKKIFEEIKNNPILNKILSENYLIFFKKFYYNTDTYINLKDYGLNIIYNF